MYIRLEEILLTLRVIELPPTTQQAPTGLIVVLHGWGSNARDLSSVRPFLNLPEYQFLFPDAPLAHPNVPDGFMWYDFRAGYSGLAESRQILSQWLPSLEATTGVPLSRTLLAGFSQGAAMALDVGLNLPLAGLIALSGYLHPLTGPLNSPAPPVLMAHGRQDQVVLLGAAHSARDTLVSAGATVHYHEFEMGHEIKPPVLALIRDFVQTVVRKQVR